MNNLQSHAISFIDEAEGIREYLLKSNNLRILLLEDKSAPVVSVMLTYLVGSRHESDAFRGGAHLLEHMMFKGTPKYNKKANTQISKELQKTGAQMNASTWKDGTNYYETLPSDKLELALDIEADRMRNSMIQQEDFESEMPVVQSEFDRLENSAFSALDIAVWQTAFKQHNYHHPIIGYRKDLNQMSARPLKDFYDTYYWPNNAVLAVIGDFETDKTLELINEKFGSIAKSSSPIPSYTSEEPLQREARHVEVKRQDPLEVVMVNYKTPPALSEDTTALDVLCMIIGRGKTSRLYRELVQTGKAAEVYCYPSKSHDAGLLMTAAILTPGTSHEEVQAHIEYVCQQIVESRVSDFEFNRAINQLRADVSYSRDGSFSMSQQLSMAIAAGSWKLFANYLKKLESITPENLQVIAKKWLKKDQQTTGYLISQNEMLRQAHENKEKQPSTHEGSIKSLEEDSCHFEIKRSSSIQEPCVGSISERITQNNIQGIETFTLAMGKSPMVTLSGSFEGGGYGYAENSALASLTVSMLDEGTLKRAKMQIAKELEVRGAKIAFDVSAKRVRFQAKCLSDDLPHVLGIISESLQEPLMDEKEFQLQKQQQEVHLEQLLANTEEQAQVQLANVFYPNSHPNHESLIQEQLQQLKQLQLKDIQAFHQDNYGLQNMIVVATGNVNQNDFESEIAAKLGSWQPKDLKHTFTRELNQNAPSSMNCLIPDKVNIDVFIAQPLSLTRDDDDYFPLYLANAILGGDFSAILSNTVRDEQGLTYSIYSDLHNVGKDYFGHWQTHLILNQKVLKKGILATVDQIKDFVNKGTTEKELIEKQNTVKGKYQVSFSTTGGAAMQIMRNQELRREVSWLDEFPKVIQSISIEDVNRAIKQHLIPSQLHLFAAGSFDEQDFKTISL